MSEQGSRRALLRTGSLVTAAVMTMNVAAYAFTLIAARLLGPREFGALSALLGVMLVAGVVGLGLQTTGARRISRRPEAAVALGHEVLALSYRAGVVLTVVAVLIAPLLTELLRLDSLLPALLLAACIGPQTVLFGQAGVIQGERRWLPLAALYGLNGIGRLVFGALGMIWRPDATGALVGMFVGALLPVLAGWLALRDRLGLPDPEASRTSGLVGELGRNVHALLAYFALSNADIVVARSQLDAHDAGLYAGGLILAKAVLFLPQFVIVLAFPSLSAGGPGRARQRLRALALVGALGALVVGGVWLLPDIAVAFVGGPEYSDIEDLLPLFAVLGSLLALIQILVYDLVARQSHAAVVAIWIAMAAVVASAVVVDSVASLLTWVVTVESVLFVVLLVSSRGRAEQLTDQRP